MTHRGKIVFYTLSCHLQGHTFIGVFIHTHTSSCYFELKVDKESARLFSHLSRVLSDPGRRPFASVCTTVSCCPGNSLAQMEMDWSKLMWAVRCPLFVDFKVIKKTIFTWKSCTSLLKKFKHLHCNLIILGTQNENLTWFPLRRFFFRNVAGHQAPSLWADWM